MGQKIGKAALIEEVESFTNLPRRAIANLWQTFNNVADGFGVSTEELEEICSDLKDELNISRVSILERTSALFKCYDTDHNGLIDALEFFASIAVLSGMKKMEILEFILTIYDFDGTQALSMDEVVLALKSCCVGLCKVQVPNKQEAREKIVIAKEEQIEQLVSHIFHSPNAAAAGVRGITSGGMNPAPPASFMAVDDNFRLNIKLLCSLLSDHPDISYWFAYFRAPKQRNLPTAEVRAIDVDYEHEGGLVERDEDGLDAANWNVQCQTARVEYDSALHPWVSPVAMLTPIVYATQQIRKDAPDTSMCPEWVYGYQSERCKNNVSYNHAGDLVYTISKYGVVYNFKNNSQLIFSGHTEEISCFKVHPDKQLVATGECGPHPRLLLWDSETLQIHYASHAKHQRGILSIAFSADGKCLLSLGNDRQHTLHVVSWAEDATLYSCQVATDPARACVIVPNNTLVVAGDSYIYFWNRSNSVEGGYTRRDGIYTRYCNHQPILCLEPVFGTDNVVAGTVDGQLLLWVDINCIRNVQGHHGAVSSLFSSAHGLISGGKDCRIRMWTSNLEPGFTFDVSHFAFNPSVRALSCSQDGTSILFGTRGANIFEISAVDGSDLRGGPIAVGHSYGELNCLAVHPSKFEFLSVGQDRTLRVMEMTSKSQLKVATFDGEALTVGYSPMGDLIVIGFGGESHSAKCGTYIVLSENDMSVIHEAKDSQLPITAIVFSPEGETLAVGSADGSICIYSVIDDYEMVAKCTRHTSPVLYLDFSLDGEWIRSNSMDRELCFFNSDDGSLQSNIASMRDVEWATNNCIYTWHMKCVHRNPFPQEVVTCAHAPFPNPEYLAFGSSLGYVQLRTFPCVDELCESIRYPAHCNAVSSLKFIFDSSRLISMGLHDRCIVQWRCEPYKNPPAPMDKRNDKDKSEDLLLEARSGEQLRPDFMPERANMSIGLLNGTAADPKELAPSPDNDVWITTTVEPTVLPTIHTNVPQMSVVLEHVYGYESQTLRNNVRYTKEGDVVYVTSTLGVVLNLTNKAQKIFQFHTDAITCFASSADGSLVATGQMGHEAMLVVWNTRTCRTVFKLPQLQLDSVCACAFSPGAGEYLAIVSNDPMHTITIYNWKANLCVSKMFGGAAQILGVCFTLSPKGVLGLVSYGLGELKFWSGLTTRHPIAMKPVYGEIGAAQNFLCCEIFGKLPTLGTSDGNLYVFDGHVLKHAVKAHNGAVNALHAAAGLLVTGGRDGVVRVWNEAHECTKEISVDSLITSFNPKVRSVCLTPDGKRIVVGTRGAEIFEVGVKDGKLLHGKPLVEFHGNRLLCGMASHPTKDEFATAGDDATLRIWDSKQYAVTKAVKLDTPSRAVCYSPDGKLLAIGFGNGARTKGKLAAKEGSFMVLKTSDWKVTFEGKDSNAFIRCLRFSPDGKILVVGSEDNCIYVYNAKDSYSKRSTLRFHQAPIVSMDFNSEGNYLYSSDTSKRFLMVEVLNGILVPTPESLRDEKWSTMSSAIGWPVKGFWMMQPPGVEPCTAQRSWGGLLTAVGNTAGKVTIAHNPTPYKAGFIQCQGHAGPLSGLVWMAGDGCLLSCGVNDHTVLQWKCLYDTSRESGDEGGRSCEDSETEFDCGHDKHLRPPPPKPVDSVNQEQLDISGAGARQGDGAVSQERWLGSIAPPSNGLRENLSLLDPLTADLEFIQGARLSDARQNIKYNCEGNLVYVVSTFGVIYNRNTVQQIFYRGHAQALISLAVNRPADLCATGELGTNPQIHIWDARTGTPVVQFRNAHTGGVSSLCFSASNDHLVSLGQDVNHSIAVHFSPSGAWHDAYCINTTSVSPSKMLWCLFIESNQFPIAVGGAGGIYFYRLVRNGAERMKGTFGKRIKIQPVLCAVCNESLGVSTTTGGTLTAENVIVTGTVSGHLYLFQDGKVVNKVTAHEAPVYAVALTKQGYLSAGKDGVVKLYSFDLKVLAGFKVNNFSPRPFGQCVHALASNLSGTAFVTAMKSGEIYETAFASQSSVMLFEAHSSGELHALDVNPTNSDQYVTVGDDGVARIWSISRRYCLAKALIEFPSRAVAWSPNGERIVLGLGTGSGVGATSSKDGAFVVLDSKNLEIIREDRKSKQFITDIKFSPNGEKVAFASGDGRVYLHNADHHWTFVGTIETTAKSAAVTRLDFSTDSKVIRLSSSSREVFYYSLDQGVLISSPMVVRDLHYHQPSVAYSWVTQGVFSRSSAVDVLAVAINAACTLIAVSYANGMIRLYRYPCQSDHAPFLYIPGIATKSTRLRFSAAGDYLLIVDAQVRSIIQFKIQL